MTRDDWDRVFGVNVIGYANTVRECLPEFRHNGAGTIVNIASVSSFIAQPEFIPYNASKGAVAQLTRCLAMDLAKDNVRVNAICPGAIRTRATDRHIASLGLDPEAAYAEFSQDSLMKRMGKPEEIAAGALFLASDESSFMTGAHLSFVVCCLLFAHTAKSKSLVGSKTSRCLPGRPVAGIRPRRGPQRSLRILRLEAGKGPLAAHRTVAARTILPFHAHVAGGKSGGKNCRPRHRRT